MLTSDMCLAYRDATLAFKCKKSHSGVPGWAIQEHDCAVSLANEGGIDLDPT